MTKLLRRGRFIVVGILIVCLTFALVGCGNSGGDKTEKSAGDETLEDKNQIQDNAQDKTAGSSKAEVVIRIGHPEAEIDIVSTPYYAYTEVFKSIVESKSGGRIQVKVFPNSQLGDLRSMMEQTARGDIEMCAGQNTGLLATYTPNIQVLEIPYSIKTTEIGREVLDGEFGKAMEQEIVEASGLRMLSWLPSSFRCFSNNVKEIKTPEDMKGLNIRTMQVPIHIAMIKALGANPTAIAFEELYSALQTGVVDGQENAPYVFLMGKLEEVQKYYTLDNHLLNTACVMINEKFFKSLSAEDQEIIRNAAQEAKLALLGIVAAKTSDDLKTIEDAGVKIYTPTSDEFEAFREKVQPFVLDELKEKVDEEWIDKYFNAVKEAEEKLSLSK